MRTPPVRRVVLSLVACFILAFSLSAQVFSPHIKPVNQSYETAFVARVVDGDTIKLSTGERIRLIGVDTPETKHPKKFKGSVPLPKVQSSAIESRTFGSGT